MIPGHIQVVSLKAGNSLYMLSIRLLKALMGAKHACLGDFEPDKLQVDPELSGCVLMVRTLLALLGFLLFWGVGGSPEAVSYERQVGAIPDPWANPKHRST